MTIRNLARVSATGLLAAGVLGLAATPALAADEVDFGLELKGTTIALEAGGKPATVNITNHGTTKPEQVSVLFKGHPTPKKLSLAFAPLQRA